MSGRARAAAALLRTFRTFALVSSVAACGDGDGRSTAGAEPDAGVADAAAEGCSSRRPPPAPTPDLHGQDLSCTDFTGADLSGVDLGGADLTGSDFAGAVLTGTDLRGAVVAGATFDGALFFDSMTGFVTGCPETLPPKWSCVWVTGRRFFLVGPGADLAGADLFGVALGPLPLKDVRAVGVVECPSKLPVLTGCHRQPDGTFVLVGPGMDLEGADLTRADLHRSAAIDLKACPAVLPAASWQCLQVSARYLLIGPGANLKNADLGLQYLHGIDLSGADLAGTRFHDSDLSGANLTGANLAGADLSGAWLVGAELSFADLTGTDISSTALGVGPSAAHAIGLVGCPWGLPPAAQCLKQADGGFALVGHGANLAGADLGGMDLSGVTLMEAYLHEANLANANLSGASLMDADFTGADLSGADLSGAIASGIHAWDLLGCPASLPPGNFQPSGPFVCVAQPENGRFALVGPGANLSGADLTGADLGGAGTVGLWTCPDRLPGAGWYCAPLGPGVPGGGMVLFGPTGDLTGLDLTGMDLSGVDLTGTDLSGAFPVGGAAGLAGCPRAAPEETACVSMGGGAFVIAGPSGSLAGFDLSGADLAGVNLRGTDVTGTILTGATLEGATAWSLTGCPTGLPAPWICRETPLSGNALLGPGVNLIEAILNGADLSGVDLTGASLVRANLTTADLAGTRLAGANVTGARLAALKNCPLSLPEPRFRCVADPVGFTLVGPWVALDGVDLTGADLTGADLTGVTLLGASLGGAVWSGTTCPDGSNSDANGGSCEGHW